MNDIDLLLDQTRNPNTDIRFKACKQLSLEPDLSQDAFITLKRALDDPDSDLVNAACQTLRTHGHNDANFDPNTKKFSPTHSESSEKPALIGNISIVNICFVILGTFMVVMTAYVRQWVASLVILMFSIGCILLAGKVTRNRHRRLTGIWSELARQTGLDLTIGCIYLIGIPRSPSISGIYRGRQVTITKVVHDEGDYDRSVSLVFTCITLEVANTRGCQLAIDSKPCFKRLFKPGSIAFGNRQFDKCFQLNGRPDIFIQKASQLIVQYPMLLERPDGLIMLTDNLISFAVWKPPSIHLVDSKLEYKQLGVLSDVPCQVQILNLLCNLAEIAE
jgi:hypothetical protein